MERILYYEEIDLNLRSAYYEKYGRHFVCLREGCKFPPVAAWFRLEEEDGEEVAVCIGASCELNSHIPEYEHEMVS